MILHSPFYNSAHEAFRDQVRRFVRTEVEPHVDEWDEAGTFPRELYRKAAQVGLLQLNYPEELGGVPADRFYSIILSQELARCGSGGVCASLMSHTIGLPAIIKFGSEALKHKVVPSVLAGEKIAALAVTEPGAGSDVANLRTSARRDGDYFVVDGEKAFITSGMRADYLTVAVRTGGAGRGGISLLLVEGTTSGLSRERRCARWDGGPPTRRCCNSTIAGCRPTHLIGTRRRGIRRYRHDVQRRTARPCRLRHWLRRSRLRGGARARQAPPHLRQAADPAPGHPPQAGRHAPADRRLASVPRTCRLADGSESTIRSRISACSRTRRPRRWPFAPRKRCRSSAARASCAA